MSTAVVQGSSGGLGFAFTQHLLKSTSLKVYALTRSSAQQLEQRLGGKHDRLTVLSEVDVREEDALEKAASKVKEREGKEDVRLIACFAGVVRPACLVLKRSQVDGSASSSQKSHSSWLRTTPSSIPFVSMPSAIS